MTGRAFSDFIVRANVRFGSKADSFGHCHVNCILEQI